MDSWPAQEARRAPHGMIASVNPLASAAGLQVLRDGGNAMDAAIAAGAVLTVVEAWSGQLGGDAFLLVASTERGTVTAINGSGAAPHHATIHRSWLPVEFRNPAVAASVPGIVDAWQVALERFGTRPLGDLAEHRTDVLDPIQATYRGWTVLQQPPVSQGLIVLIALKILEGLDPSADPADHIHLQPEAHKLALAERLSHVGDPAFPHRDRPLAL